MSAMPKRLILDVADLSILYAAYMPFLARGGLFVVTNKPFDLGDHVTLEASIIDWPKQILEGQIAWITPPRAGTHRPQGVGVHFPDTPDAQKLRGDIEAALGELLRSPRRTYTM